MDATADTSHRRTSATVHERSSKDKCCSDEEGAGCRALSQEQAAVLYHRSMERKLDEMEAELLSTVLEHMERVGKELESQDA